MCVTDSLVSPGIRLADPGPRIQGSVEPQAMVSCPRRPESHVSYWSYLRIVERGFELIVR